MIYWDRALYSVCFDDCLSLCFAKLLLLICCHCVCAKYAGVDISHLVEFFAVFGSRLLVFRMCE